METLWLGYTDPNVSGGTLQARRFEVLTDYEVPAVEHEKSRTLTSKLRKIVKGKWSTWRITIGVNALLSDTDKAFMRAFWSGFEQFVAFNSSEGQPADNLFVEIDCGDGEAPIEFVNGIKEFESWSLLCVQVDGSLS